VILLITDNGIKKEIESKIKDVEHLLEGMLQDRSVPRNIKKRVQEGLIILKKAENTPEVIASNIVYLFNDLSFDSNIAFHSRSTLYRIISILETIKD